MTRPLALVAFTVFLLTSQAASARPKVALTQIDGDASGDVHDAVAEALEGKELSLISSREVNRAVGKLGDLADLTEKDFKKLANDLEADAIVLGKLDQVGSSRTLRFRLYVHKRMAKGFTVSFKDAKSEKFRTLLHDKMLDKLGASPAGAVEDDDKPTRKKKTGEDDEDPLATKADAKAKKGAKVKKAKGGDDEDEPPAKKAKGGDDEDIKPKKAKAKAKLDDADEDEPTAKKAKGGDDEDIKPKKAAKGGDDLDAKSKKAKADDEDIKPKKARADKDEGGGPADDDDAKPSKRAISDEEPRKPRKKVARTDDGDDLDAGITASVEPTGRTANRFAIRLDVGVSVLQRSFTFNAKPATTSPGNTSLSPVPGVRFEAEVFPLALSNPSSAAAGIGMGVDYDKTFGLNLTGKANGASVNVPVKQSSYSIDLRYRLAFGKTETSSTLTLGVGYGKRLFSPQIPAGTDAQIITAIQRDTPRTEYAMFDPGLTFRMPVSRTVALSLGGRGLIISDTGTIQGGDSYGRATVYGAEGGAAIDVLLGSRFALRFAGEFTQIGFAFKGVGKLSNGLDGDMTSKDVGGLSDRAIGGFATLGVLY